MVSTCCACDTRSVPLGFEDSDSFQMDVNNDKELTLKEFVDGCLADKELFQILTNEVKK